MLNNKNFKERYFENRTQHDENNLREINRLLSTRYGYLGPLILTAFLGIFGIIWLLIRLFGNQETDNRINNLIFDIKDVNIREEARQLEQANRDKCKSETKKGVFD